MAIVHGCGGVCGRNEYIREAQPPFRSYLQGGSHTIIVQVGSLGRGLDMSLLACSEAQNPSDPTSPGRSGPGRRRPGSEQTLKRITKTRNKQ